MPEPCQGSGALATPTREGDMLDSAALTALREHYAHVAWVGHVPAPWHTLVEAAIDHLHAALDTAETLREQLDRRPAPGSQLPEPHWDGLLRDHHAWGCVHAWSEVARLPGPRGAEVVVWACRHCGLRVHGGPHALVRGPEHGMPSMLRCQHHWQLLSSPEADPPLYGCTRCYWATSAADAAALPVHGGTEVPRG